MSKEVKMNLFNYDIIQTFNETYYKDLLLNSHINDTEKFIGTAKDEVGNEVEVNKVFFPMKKGMKNYLLPQSFIKELPILVDEVKLISVSKEVYYVVTDRTPWGLRPEKKYETNGAFLNKFYSYKHTSKDDFDLLKVMILVSYLKRLNIRISSLPSFGKDSIANVLKLLLGDIGIVHNPTMPKIEWLLTNKILVTNEVAGIKSVDKDNLQQYLHLLF